MITSLGSATRRDGRTAELVLMTTPEPADVPGLVDLLGHKGDSWREHVTRAVAGELEGLETRFYLALDGGRAVSNIMLVEFGGVGILGHVFTRPEHRRQGLCEALFGVLKPEFVARGGRRLLLHTGYDSAPYHIYLRQGWVDVTAGSGFMQWQPGAPTQLAGPWHVGPYRWGHWPALAEVFADGGEHGLQARGLGMFGPDCFEGPGLELKVAAERGECEAWVVDDASRRAAALAVLSADREWPGWRNLDLVCAPAAAETLGVLLAEIEWGDGPVGCWLPAADAVRAKALASAGWTREARLRGLLADGGSVDVWRREG
ncbi:MAG TPA: hypothetical protein DCZ72_10005 [Armatimonadetes bacterium]|nr:hypothetical protein [Armatimonadota bacterium]